jgi:protoporphyrinogen oxidase
MRPLKNLCEVAVIGGGLSGLSAALHAATLGRYVTLFEGSGMYGGQVATVDEVDGVPVPGKFSGQDIAIRNALSFSA